MLYIHVEKLEVDDYSSGGDKANVPCHAHESGEENNEIVLMKGPAFALLEYKWSFWNINGHKSRFVLRQVLQLSHHMTKPTK